MNIVICNISDGLYLQYGIENNAVFLTGDIREARLFKNSNDAREVIELLQENKMRYLRDEDGSVVKEVAFQIGTIKCKFVPINEE